MDQSQYEPVEGRDQPEHTVQWRKAVDSAFAAMADDEEYQAEADDGGES